MASAAPKRVAEVRQPGKSEGEAPRRGFSRFLASLLALIVVAGGAWVVITLINAGGVSDTSSANGGASGTGDGGAIDSPPSVGTADTPPSVDAVAYVDEHARGATAR